MVYALLAFLAFFFGKPKAHTPLIVDIHNSIMDIHNSIMDIRN